MKKLPNFCGIKSSLSSRMRRTCQISSTRPRPFKASSKTTIIPFGRGYSMGGVCAAVLFPANRQEHRRGSPPSRIVSVPPKKNRGPTAFFYFSDKISADFAGFRGCANVSEARHLQTEGGVRLNSRRIPQVSFSLQIKAVSDQSGRITQRQCRQQGVQPNMKFAYSFGRRSFVTLDLSHTEAR